MKKLKAAIQNFTHWEEVYKFTVITILLDLFIGIFDYAWNYEYSKMLKTMLLTQVIGWLSSYKINKKAMLNGGNSFLDFYNKFNGLWTIYHMLKCLLICFVGWFIIWLNCACTLLTEWDEYLPRLKNFLDKESIF